MTKKILIPLHSYSNHRVYYVYREYLHMLKKHGIDPIIIGASSDDTLEFLAHHCDGLLLSGGMDIDPMRYHQQKNPLTKIEEKELEDVEFKLISMFHKKNKPILGICRGLQTINVAFNGTLIQDINETNRYSNHLQNKNLSYCHSIKTLPDTKIQKYLGNEFMVNSYHHQAIDQLASGFIVSAITSDGIIEGIEKDNIIAVQWHPEKNNDEIQNSFMKLLKDLLNEDI